MNVSKKKIIVILGPTASGKSELAVKLAQKINGEIISADSRQVYKGMNIGTGKITEKEKEGIAHYLLDVASPKRKFTVAQYKKMALKAVDKIFKKGKIPIFCGGTGFYIQAVVENLTLPEVKPDWKLRKQLEKKSTIELYRQLKKLDPRRAATIDKDNPRRLIRAIEIVLRTKKPVPKLASNPLPYPLLFIGIKRTKKDLEKLIEKRLLKRIRQGMIEEVKKLRKSGISFKRLEEFGLEYRWLARYLEKKISKEEMIENLRRDIIKFAKRQMIWFKKYPGEKIKWIKNWRETLNLSKRFLNSD